MFDFGTMPDKRAISSNVSIGEINDNLSMANARKYGKVLRNSEALTTIVGTNKITPTTAVSVTMINKIIALTAGADSGDYLIIGIDGADYLVYNTSMAAPSFAGVVGTGIIYDSLSAAADTSYTFTQLNKIISDGADGYDSSLPTFNKLENSAQTTNVHLKYLRDKHLGVDLIKSSTIKQSLSIVTGDTEKIIAITTGYRNASNQLGLAIADAGARDVSNYKLTYVELIDQLDNNYLHTDDGTQIWGRLFDGVTNGVGEGTDIEIKYFTGSNDATATPYTMTAIENGKTITARFWTVTTKYALLQNENDIPEAIGSGKILHAGDAELSDNVKDINKILGKIKNQVTPDITNKGDFYLFSQTNMFGPSNEDETTYQELVNSINNWTGPLNWTGEPAVIAGILPAKIDDTDGKNLTTILKDIGNAIVGGNAVGDYIFVAANEISPGTPINLPNLHSYKSNPANQASGEAGKYLIIYLDGIRQQANSTNYINDYDETSEGVEGITAGTITFNSKKVKKFGRISFTVKRKA